MERKKERLAYCGHSVGWKEELMQGLYTGEGNKSVKMWISKKKKKKNPYITDWEKMKTVRKQWTLLDNSS